MKRLFLCLMLLLLPGLSPAAELTVFAASSLTGALQELADNYQARHAGSSIQLHFAGSQSLATQIQQGAPADLFISANQTAMNRLLSAELVEAPQLLARNRLVVACTPELKPTLQRLADLGRPGLLLTIGNPQVPVGRYTRQLFKSLEQDNLYGPELVASFQRNIVSEENQVKAIVAKLLLGEVDAGIVYQSDLHGTPLLRLELPEAHNPQASYPVALVQGGDLAAARDFLAYLVGPESQETLSRYGLLPAGVIP